MKKLKEYLDLFWTFFKIGAVTFGGGVAMLPILERDLVDKKHWTDNDELLDYYAIAQTTPGIIAVNVSTFIGHKRNGIVGGIVATLGVVTPSIIIITLIAKFISTIDDIPWVKKALAGINIAVAANLTYATIKFAKRSVNNLLGAVLLLVSFILIYFFNVNTIWVIFAAIIIGIVEAAVTGQLNTRTTGEERSDSDKRGEK